VILRNNYVSDNNNSNLRVLFVFDLYMNRAVFEITSNRRSLTITALPVTGLTLHGLHMPAIFDSARHIMSPNTIRPRRF